MEQQQQYDLFGVEGRHLLAETTVRPAFRDRIDSLCRLIDHLTEEITAAELRIHDLVVDDRGFQAIQAIPGVGATLAAIFVAEIGDVTRFHSARHLTSWAGLTPKYRESDNKVRRGHITKQGSRLVRWAAVEGTARQHGHTLVKATHRRVGERAAGPSVASPRRASSSLSSPTASGTARSAPWPRRDEAPGAGRRELGATHGPSSR